MRNILIAIITIMIMGKVNIVQAIRLDPFSLPRCHARKSLAHPTLKGIVRQGQCCGALLVQGQKTKIVFAGDIFAGHAVVSVDQQNVCLTRGNQQITLTLEEKED